MLCLSQQWVQIQETLRIFQLVLDLESVKLGQILQLCIYLQCSCALPTLSFLPATQAPCQDLGDTQPCVVPNASSSLTSV